VNGLRYVLVRTYSAGVFGVFCRPSGRIGV
jgi:hypothetical protein